MAIQAHQRERERRGGFIKPGTRGENSVVWRHHRPVARGSNVDIANEFTKLIIYRRSYSANARVVTTTDEISQETINIKR